MLLSKLIYFEIRHDGFTARFVPADDHALNTAADPTRFPPAEIAAAFGHPRLIIADFEPAVNLFSAAMRQLFGRRGFLKPVVVLRLCHRFGDSVTPLERLCLLDALEHAGARAVYFCGTPHPPSDDEIRAATQKRT